VRDAVAVLTDRASWGNRGIPLQRTPPAGAPKAAPVYRVGTLAIARPSPRISVRDATLGLDAALVGVHEWTGWDGRPARTRRSRGIRAKWNGLSRAAGRSARSRFASRRGLVVWSREVLYRSDPNPERNRAGTLRYREARATTRWRAGCCGAAGRSGSKSLLKVKAVLEAMARPGSESRSCRPPASPCTPCGAG
jgi:hypothetical protein